MDQRIGLEGFSTCAIAARWRLVPASRPQSACSHQRDERRGANPTTRPRPDRAPIDEVVTYVG